MISIRRFLVVVLLAAITLANFLAALHGYRTSMDEADALFDAQLADIAAVLASTIRDSGVMGRSDDGGRTITFQIWRDGELESASASAPSEPIAPLESGYADVNFSGYRWRTFTRHLEDDRRWLIVAERADVRFALAQNVITESVLPIILVLPVVGLLIWVIVGRALRPLGVLAEEMGNKRSDDLSPIAEKDSAVELAVLIDSINSLLGRLEASFERERRFAADAAHELRTPISVLKVQLHNLLHETGGQSEPIAQLQKTAERMERSVEQVLTLYRTSPDQYAAKFEWLDLAGIAREAIADIYPQLELRGQQIELDAESATMRGDIFALRTLLGNLLGNASKYSGEDGQIYVAVRKDAGNIVLTIEDSGPGIPAEQRSQVFDRYYRVEGDRHDPGIAGSGIGLTIVQHIAEIHGASISLGESRFASGLAVHVRFPVDISVRKGGWI